MDKLKEITRDDQPWGDLYNDNVRKTNANFNDFSTEMEAIMNKLIANTLVTETYTVAITELRQFILNLPRYLNNNIAINVEAGTTNDIIEISNFWGPGILSIVGGGNLAVSSNYIVNRFIINYCSNTRVIVQGFKANASDNISFEMNMCSGFISINYSLSDSGVKTTSTNYGISATSCPQVTVFGCSFSNKSRAILAHTNVTIAPYGISGSNNAIGFYSSNSVIAISSAGNLAADILYAVVAGGRIYGTDGVRLPMPTWNTFTYQNGWSGYTDDWTPYYTKDADGYVFMQGLLIPPSATVGAQVITNIPSGFRPKRYQVFTSFVYAYDGKREVNYITVASHGNISFGQAILIASPIWVSFQATYKAEG